MGQVRLDGKCYFFQHVILCSCFHTNFCYEMEVATSPRPRVLIKGFYSHITTLGSATIFMQEWHCYFHVNNTHSINKSSPNVEDGC